MWRHRLPTCGLALSALLALAGCAATQQTGAAQQPTPASADSVCAIAPDRPSGLARLAIAVDPATHDTTLLRDGRRGESLKAGLASIKLVVDQEWFQQGKPLIIGDGRRAPPFKRAGHPQVLPAQDLAYLGTAGGIALYALARDSARLGLPRPRGDIAQDTVLLQNLSRAEVLFLPAAPYGCLFQPMVHGETAAMAGPPLPSFPEWPPPQASDRTEIPATLLPPGPATLGQVADRIAAAFDSAGYGAIAYYAVPGGFAMVSRLEQINPDGTPREGAARWSAQLEPPDHFTLGSFLTALFRAPKGYYRVIVVTVTTLRFNQSERMPSQHDVEQWAVKGFDGLTDEVARTPFGSHHVTALIYEFEKPDADAQPQPRTPGRLKASDHLKKAGIWQALLRMT